MAAGTLAAKSGLTVAMLDAFFETVPQSPHAAELRATANLIANNVSATKTWPADLACSQAQDEIRASLRLPVGWDSYVAPPPSAVAVQLAIRMIDIIRDNFFGAPHIVPSTEGGIAAAFSVNDKFAQIELLNSGTVLTTIYSSNTPPQITRFASDGRSLSSAVETLRNFLSR